MSGTRLLLRKAQATKPRQKPALLIVSHGDRGGDGTDQLAHEIAREAGSTGRYAAARTCFMSKGPSLKKSIGSLPRGPVLIYPLFMSNGYFMRKILSDLASEDIAAQGRSSAEIHITKPIGLNRSLPGLVAESAMAEAIRLNWPIEKCRLLLAAHGSQKSAASRRATEAIATALAQQTAFSEIELGFLDETPWLADQIECLDGPLIIVGLFASSGLHGGNDLPEAVAKAGRSDAALVSQAVWSQTLKLLACQDIFGITDEVWRQG